MRRTAVCLAGVLSGMSIPVAAWAQERPYDYWGIHPFWGAWGIGMMLMLLVLCGLVIVGFVFGIRWLGSQEKESRSDSAVEILRQRYARGEISKEEFEAKKREIS